jgi:hypothetical protein
MTKLGEEHGGVSFWERKIEGGESLSYFSILKLSGLGQAT